MISSSSFQMFLYSIWLLDDFRVVIWESFINFQKVKIYEDEDEFHLV